jgi:hypothetical protein
MASTLGGGAGVSEELESAESAAAEALSVVSEDNETAKRADENIARASLGSAVTEEQPVEIHKPKPVHNWREFLKEYAIIVLGVATALIAEQGMEWLHWRGQVAQAQEQIAHEMASNMGGAITRIRIAQCVEQRLDALALILDEAGKSGTLPPVGDISMPSHITWLTGVWDSLVASQTAPHFPTSQLQNLAAIYKTIQNFDDTTRQEMQEWKNLYAIVGPGRRLDPASEAVLRQALSQARGSNRAVTNLSNLMLREAGVLQFPFSPDDRAVLAQIGHRQLTGNKPTLYRPLGLAICGPIGPVPATYGQAPMSAMPSLLNEAVKAVPDFSADTP